MPDDVKPIWRQQLRKRCVEGWGRYTVSHNDLAELLDAADERDRLKEENARLREALTEITDFADQCLRLDEDARIMRDIARAALEGQTR